MIVREITEKEINRFIEYGSEVYNGDKNYVPYMRGQLKKTISNVVFKKKKYAAVCAFDDSDNIKGRMLITVGANIGPNKQLNSQKCGYFSHFEVDNDQQVFNAMLDYGIEKLKEQGAEYIVGPYFLDDPDDRRGVLIDGYELSPMLFSSYNPDYYRKLFENYGFRKLKDAFEYEYEENAETIEKIKEIAEKSISENDFHISKLDYKNLERDISDAHRIMEIASTEINFENVISYEKLYKLFKKLKPFVDPDYALIARRNEDDSPIGFTLSIPDYNEVIRKMGGKINPRTIAVFLTERKKIKGLRAMLQYIIPEYQHKGVSKALYYETKKAVDKNRVQRITLGTIMENNMNSNGAIVSLGGKISKVYRIYYKEIGE